MKNIDKKEELIYDLIFSEKEEFIIDFSDFMKDIYRYEDFISDIKKILKKSKVSVVKEKIDLKSSTIIWEIKVKK